MEKSNNAIEIMPGMTMEEIRALYFDSTALVEPAYRIYQLNSDGHRYYYRFENGEPVFYPSVTTLLSQTMPTSPFLIQWMLDNGKEGAVEKRDLAAAYGTFMHAQFERVIINRSYDFDAVPDVLAEYMRQNNLPDKFFYENVNKIRKDVLAFVQFVRDWSVQPLAIEIGLVHPEHRYAGCVDMPCVMTDPKTGEIFTAIVDFKSGRKGFFEEHEIQLHLYREMWNVNFPDKPVQRVFNFSPKDWRKAPSYNLKDQTDSPNAAKVPYILGLAAIEDDKRDNVFTVIRGTLNIDEGDLSDNVLTLSLADLIKEKQSEAVPGDNSEYVKVLEEWSQAGEKRPNSEPKPEKKGITKAEPKRAEKRAEKTAKLLDTEIDF